MAKAINAGIAIEGKHTVSPTVKKWARCVVFYLALLALRHLAGLYPPRPT